MLVAIHQPNFLPWLGYFDKLCRADIFVILDDVPIQHTGGSWVNRCRVRRGQEERWLTIPIRRASGHLQPISKVQVATASDPGQRTHALLANYYRNAKYLDSTLDLLARSFQFRTSSLAHWNLYAIRELAKAANIRMPEMVYSAELGITGSGTEKLVGLVRAVRGTSYLFGAGAAAYQDDELFLSAGINLIPQRLGDNLRYSDSPYDLLEGFSIVDTFMRIGSQEVASLFKC